MLQVQDLHSITPDHFLEVSGGIIHPLSYQQVGPKRYMYIHLLLKTVSFNSEPKQPIILLLLRPMWDFNISSNMQHGFLEIYIFHVHVKLDSKPISC